MVNELIYERSVCKTNFALYWIIGRSIRAFVVSGIQAQNLYIKFESNRTIFVL